MRPHRPTVRGLLPRLLPFALVLAPVTALAAPRDVGFDPVTAAAAAVGASQGFTSLEAESGTLVGGASGVALTAPPTTEYSSAALEASGHAYVHLASTGQGVQWTNTTGAPISFLNVRASIPDAPSGGGITSTLDLYVNGVFRQALNVNSKQTYIYEGTNYNNSDDKNPADGDPRVFWDESHAFLTGAAIAPGATFSLVKDSANSASYYNVDVVDAENPPAPIAQPANSISITSCGAVADNAPTNGSADPGAQDSTGAIQNCINQAQSQNKTLWIPQGTFYLKGTTGLQATGITIAGAGMWYSTVYRDVPLPNSQPLAAVFSVTSCTVQNFHIDSDATSRGTVGGDGGAMDTTGTNWVADGMWNQHTESGFWASGTGGTVKNSRVTSEWADGINLNNVSLTGTVGNNITATNNFVRGTGDDAMAINSVAYNGSTTYTPMSNVTLTNNTLIAPWGGKGIGIYGGSGHHVQNNYISDTARYIGLGAGRFGVNGSDLHGATVSGNTVVRSGGDAYNQGQPAFHIGNGGDGQNTGVVDSVNATGNTIVNSLYDGVGFSQSTNSTFANNTITSPWRNGIVIQPPFYPAPTGSASITGNTVSGLGGGLQPYINNSGGFTATLSGNSWQGGGGTPPPTEGPYGGTPAAVPGTLQAENYDTGGEGVGYHVTSTNGSGNTYRADGVDLEATSDTGGGSDLGWTSGGQWFRYTVNVASAGPYAVSLRVAAPSAVTGALHIANASGTNLSGAVNLPQTGGWQTWSTVTAIVTLPAGQQVLTVNEDTGGWNLNYLALATAGGGSPPPNPNLALNQPTSTSGSVQSYGSGNAVDGNTSTYWESTNNAFPQWVQVDLGSAHSVGRVVLNLPPSSSWGARTQTIQIQGSTDGTNYTTLAASKGYTFDPASGNTATATFTSATVRYVKLTVTANTGWPAGQLSEVGVFAS
ncbi:coagulation factor 5/8 type domain protein [Catenulispora acidiphila DSM 44928]|uniref:Coagulation factor 5/8 type domain protein n=1 Tax=Catenulispora acidiphila (strain DSM 44928 / JCM 14897 / NBRC 102108 / NRRL B-24433 / ID139908) TaxID=479433 RepID=C7QJW3_CATAD|nr:discoidin domain-containing protein [Catenulispora acidiphila]ACU73201.1 coagulation factor 5/8 type domain protein [Catenulispora acidiphila DSM 44928]